MIQLVPMTEAEFQSYYEHTLADYAEEHVRGGRWSPEEAYEQASREFQALLPDGVATENHHLFIVRDSTTQAAVGVLWYALQSQAGRKTAFVYDINIDSNFRRQGYATKALRSLEDQVRAQGAQEIRLHVFGHNEGAQALYEKLGYLTTNVMMAKSLDM